MNVGYLIVAVLAASVTLFALQNTDQTAVRFVLWRLERVPDRQPRARIARCGAADREPLTVDQAERLARPGALSVETRVKMLEGAVEERDRQLLRMPRQG